MGAQREISSSEREGRSSLALSGAAVRHAFGRSDVCFTRTEPWRYDAIRRKGS